MEAAPVVDPAPEEEPAPIVEQATVAEQLAVADAPAVAEPPALAEPATVAEARPGSEPPTCLEPATIAEAPSVTEPPAFAAPPETMELPAAVVAPPPLPPPASAPVVEPAPCSPERAPLKHLTAPAPATPISVSDEDDVNATQVAKTKAPSTAVAAQHTIETTLLALAREIRQPGRYVGYSAFILMGLIHKCQPCMWEGENRINLIETFAPWAIGHCTKAIIVTAIACKLIAKPGGSVECRPISTTHPLDRTSHFVAGVPIPTAAVAGTHNDFDAYYASHGTAALASICDGDCGLDVMAMMLGEPSTREYRSTLRIDISDYLMSRMGEHWMLELMALCQELKQEDVTRYQSEGHFTNHCCPNRSRGVCQSERRPQGCRDTRRRKL